MKIASGFTAVLSFLLIVGGSAGAKSPSQRSVIPSGKQVFERWCAACHDDGPRYPGTAALKAKYGEDLPAALERRTDLTPDMIELFVRQGILSMPPFRKTEISDAELKALGQYLNKKDSR